MEDLLISSIWHPQSSLYFSLAAQIEKQVIVSLTELFQWTVDSFWASSQLKRCLWKWQVDPLRFYQRWKKYSDPLLELKY